MSAASAGLDTTGSNFEFGGLNGKALRNAAKPLSEYPKKGEVMKAIPEECFVKDTAKSMLYATISTALTAACVSVGFMIPLQAAWIPVWLAYGFVTGTVATGCWVVAHECGHNAFSDNKLLQDTVGYILHSVLLVPYFSWQRSHAVHHARTNHVTEGETHVPSVAGTDKGDFGLKLKESVSEGPFAIINMMIVFLFGWPAYLLYGASGGPVRGTTNHFLPGMGAQNQHALFPGQWRRKVWYSDVGVVAVVAGLVAWGMARGPMEVFAVYALPYLGVNFWLVLYTWLQHTDVDIPHYGGKEWNWVKGAFLTVDRPYGALCDFLHHRIGSTHVAHHVSHQIPHYNAVKATEALKTAFPDLYLYDPTPIAQATMRVATKCIAVEENRNGAWTFTDKVPQQAAVAI